MASCLRSKPLTAVLVTMCVLNGVGFPNAGDTTQTPANPTLAGKELCLHGIKLAACPFCTPTLLLSDGFCREHGISEALCIRCRPFLKTAFQANGDWCDQHEMQESQCTICNPDRGRAATHETPPPTRSDAPASRHGATRRAALPPSPTCKNSRTPVRLQSADVVRTSGLQFAQVKDQPLTATIIRTAEVVYNANRYARLSPRASGVIVEVLRDLGDTVMANEALAGVDSAELGSAKAEHLQALAGIQLWKQTAERQRSLADLGIGTESEAIEAENKHAEAQISLAKAGQRLRNLGLADVDIAALEQSRDTSSRLHLRAPFNGIVVERSAVLGEIVDTTTVLFALADTRLMWVLIDLFEKDGPHVSVGQEVEFALDSLPGRVFPGKITWVSSHLDTSTRTLKARAEIANENGVLRANAFGRAQIMVRRAERALVVPKEAVQWDGCCNLVFVRSKESGTTFQPTQVQLGIDTGEGYEAISGVKTGDIVVTTGSYLLKTEILKASIGAGCCDHVEKLQK